MARYAIVPHGISASRRYAVRDNTTGFFVKHGFASTLDAQLYVEWIQSEDARIDGIKPDRFRSLSIEELRNIPR